MSADVRSFYAELGIPLPDHDAPNVATRCFTNPAAHSHSDRAPSCSVSTEHGCFYCHACGDAGGAYDAAVARGRAPAQVMEMLRRHGFNPPDSEAWDTTRNGHRDKVRLGAEQDPSRSSWSPIELGPVVAGVQAGEIIGPVPTLVPRTDGVPLFYRGEVHSISGEPESCKGWIVLHGARTVLALGGQVLYLDFEDAAPSIVLRLLALGATPEAIIDRFQYVRPVDPFDRDEFSGLLKRRDYQFAAIDGLTEAYGLLGLDLASNEDAAKFLSAMPRPIADHGAAVVLMDHVGRNKETRGRYAIGAQHKLAGIAVAYSTEVIKPLSRTGEGLVKLKVNKDRHGHVRGHTHGGQIALARITPQDNGEHVTVRLQPPEDNTGAGGEFRPTNLMEKISRFIEAETEPPSRNTIKSGVPGKTDYKDLALRLLVAEGYVERVPDGQTQRHRSAIPYREADDRSPGPQPVPNRSPGPAGPTGPPVPHPLQGGPGPGPGNTHPFNAPPVPAVELAVEPAVATTLPAGERSEDKDEFLAEVLRRHGDNA